MFTDVNLNPYDKKVIGAVAIFFKKQNHQPIQCNININNIQISINNQMYNTPIFNALEVFVVLSAPIAIICLFMGIHLTDLDDFGTYRVYLFVEVTSQYFYGIILPIIVCIRKKSVRTFIWREFKDFVGL